MTTNRRKQYLSGFTLTPLNEFWQLGNLTAMDPEIPNLPLEANIKIGWFEAWRPPPPSGVSKVYRNAPSIVGPLDQASAAPEAPPPFGWFMQSGKPAPSVKGPASSTANILNPFNLPESSNFGWYSQIDRPRPKPAMRTADFFASVFTPSGAPNFGWFEQFNSLPKKLVRASDSYVAVFAPDIGTPNFGWFEQIERPPIALPKVPLTTTATFVPTPQVQNYGWFEPWGKPQFTPKRNAVSDVITDFVAPGTPAQPFGWFAYWRLPTINRPSVALLNTWANSPPGPPPIVVDIPSTLGGGLDPWLGPVSFYNKWRPTRKVEDDIEYEPAEHGPEDEEIQEPEFVPKLAAPMMALRYNENVNKLQADSTDEMIIIELLL